MSNLLKKLLILTFILLALLLSTGFDKTITDGITHIIKFDDQNIQCNDYQNFKNETWYSNLLLGLKKNDKIDIEGARIIQILSSSNPGSVEEIINKEGKITESDIVKICNVNGRTIIIITQGKSFKYLFSFDINSQKLSRVTGNMVIGEDEKINLPEIKGDLITIRTTSYGNNKVVWEKVFHYNLKDNSVFHFETCKLEENIRNCEEIKNVPFNVTRISTDTPVQYFYYRNATTS